MPRKMMVESADGKLAILTETPADDEAQLQVLVKDHPELIPVEEFGMTGPVMVVGRETRLQSGAVDLVALARSGDLLVIEFKTGPQNSDFRAALAQLLDYGSDLWGMSLEDFEAAVAVRYFSSKDCQDEKLKNKGSLQQAAKATWPDLSEEELEQFLETLSRQLETGFCHYVLMAQRFTNTMETTTKYLNTITPAVSFWAVELVRFTGGGMSAFETRTMFKPPSGTGRPPRIDEENLLAQVPDAPYREALRELLAACRGLGLTLYSGAAGISIRVPVTEQPGFVSVAWLFPPEKRGYRGLRDWTMGYDESLKLAPATLAVLENYVGSVQSLPGVEETKTPKMRVLRCSPEVVVASKDQIVNILAEVLAGLSDTE